MPILKATFSSLLCTEGHQLQLSLTKCKQNCDRAPENVPFMRTQALDPLLLPLFPPGTLGSIMEFPYHPWTPYFLNSYSKEKQIALFLVHLHLHRACFIGGKLLEVSHGPSLPTKEAPTRHCPTINSRVPRPHTYFPARKDQVLLTFVFLTFHTSSQNKAMQTTDTIVCCVKQVKTSISVTQVEKALTELPNNPFCPCQEYSFPFISKFQVFYTNLAPDC